MKKRLLSFIAAILVIIANCEQVFATNEFDLSAFEGNDDIVIERDDMTGESSIYLDSLQGEKGYIVSSNGDWVVRIIPNVNSLDLIDAYFILGWYVGYSWKYIDEMIVKVGNKSYFFSDLDVERSVTADDTNIFYVESFSVVLDGNSIPFMQDLIEYRDEEIRVRLVGSEGDAEFVLPVAVKDGIIGLYDRFVLAGGTRDENLKWLTDIGKTDVKVRQVG